LANIGSDYISYTMPIYDITPFSALDFSGKLSAILWFAGCNMRCQYCYNPHIVFGKGEISADSALRFLHKRKCLLDGVVLSGGEPTMYDGLLDFCEAIKAQGYAIKLDTNGSKPARLQELLGRKLLDFVAIDFKAPPYKYTEIAGGGSFSSFEKSLKLLISSSILFEVRTTVHQALLDSADISWMRRFLYDNGYDKTLYLQAYRHSATIGNLEDCSFSRGFYDDIEGIEIR
jgi:pyruvate formate lyase activating enzyme